MTFKETFDLIGNVDIYVIDQILKGRYNSGDSILDAGCGGGRNLKWFYKNEFQLTGIDADKLKIEQASAQYPRIAANLLVANLENLPFGENSFDHIICSAVLHFARGEAHFYEMFNGLVRVLKPRGTLFVRVASDIGLDQRKTEIENEEKNMPGNFYITRKTVVELLSTYPIELAEPVKTTNVQDVRAMTTLVFMKHNKERHAD